MNKIKYIDMLITKKYDAVEICVTEEWNYGIAADVEFIFMYNNSIDDFYIPYCIWFERTREPLKAIWKERICDVFIYRETDFNFKMHINFEEP